MASTAKLLSVSLRSMRQPQPEAVPRESSLVKARRASGKPTRRGGDELRAGRRRQAESGERSRLRSRRYGVEARHSVTGGFSD